MTHGSSLQILQPGASMYCEDFWSVVELRTMSLWTIISFDAHVEITSNSMGKSAESTILHLIGFFVTKKPFNFNFVDITLLHKYYRLLFWRVERVNIVSLWIYPKYCRQCTLRSTFDHQLPYFLYTSYNIYITSAGESTVEIKWLSRWWI